MNVQVLSKHPMWVIVCAILLIALATGCSQDTSAANPAPPGVEVVEVQQKDVPIYSEWIGTLDGLVNADIKAQVPGYLQKQDYTEGSFVRKGQLLFQIDPRPFQAALDQAQGQLAQANGQLGASQGAIGPGAKRRCGGGGQSAQNAARCRPLHPARRNNRPSRSRISTTPRRTTWPPRRRCRRPRRRWKRPRPRFRPPTPRCEAAKAAVETAQRQSGIHAADVADRRHRRDRAAAGGRAGEPGQRRRHDGLDASIRSRSTSPSASRSISTSTGGSQPGPRRRPSETAASSS